MKTPSQLDTLVAKETAPALLPVRVCMHVLGSARADGRVMREAAALAEDGCAVSIVDIESASRQPAEEEIRGVFVKHVIVSSSFLTTRFARWPLIKAAQLLIRCTLRLMQVPADIYHAHDVSGLLPCYIAARLRRKPLIFDSHELPLSDTSITSRWLLGLLASLLVHIVPRCAGVIAVSPPIAQEIQKHYRAPDVSLIRNVPPYRAIPRSDKLRHYLQVEAETRIALYQGYLQPGRGLDMLIRAAKFLNRDSMLVMMGEGIGVTLSQLEALIVGEGVAERIRIIPPVPYAELLDWTASADIGLIIYRLDYSMNVQMCLPNKFFEYLMAGLPVLASPLDAVADIIRTYDVGQIVSSLTPSNIAASINAMLADPVALTAMRRNALVAAQNEFCWEKERQQLIRLYHNIVTV